MGFFVFGSEIDFLFFIVLSFVDTGYLQKAWLDKSTGGVCLSISSRGLAITGIDDRRYWNHTPTEESR